ncbi:hypothetical protein HZB89_01870 [archaeon]|nr:hypothetical protein [archaeon]
MYGESGAEEPLPAPSFGGGESLRTKLSYHLEGLVPVILIIIIGVFVLWRFGVINTATPILGPSLAAVLGSEQPARLLVIGQPSPETIAVLNDPANKDIVQVTYRSVESLERNPKDQLAPYRILMLDQSSQADKLVSRQLGEAIKNFVKTGGRLIIVGNSGIRRPEDSSVLGWQATFGDIVPVDCEVQVGKLEEPSCVQQFAVRGKLYRLDYKHPILEGIPQLPVEPGTLTFETYNVTVAGKELAYLESEPGRQYYTAIVEKPLITGKSIYFNYNPGSTPVVFINTLKYLR